MAEKINFFNEDSSFTVKHKVLLRGWIRDCIKKEKYATGNINIILCSDKYLHEINVKYLNHDTFTDIITFNYSENNTISGDLFISIERVIENTGQYSNNSSDELHRVIIHGVLHLCKYNDKTISDKQRMTEKENKYLACRPDKLRI
jgi:probable rRNA maturation factor